MKKIIILTIIIISQIIYADQLTFENAVNIALQNNQQIMIAKNSVQIAENNVNPGNAGLLPTLSLTGNSSYTKSELSTGIDSELHLNSAQLRASYTLFNGFGNINRYKQLKTLKTQTELQSRYNIENVIFNVSQSFFTVASTQENYNIMKESLNISRDRLKRIQEKGNYGQARTVEILAAEVDYNRDSINVVLANQNLMESKRNLNSILNREIDTELEVIANIEFHELGNMVQLKSFALANNSNYLASIQGLELAEINYNISKSSYWPSLSLTGSNGFNKNAIDFDPGLSDPDKSWSVGLSMNFNLFNGFRTKINNQNAKIAIQNQKLLLEQSKLELEKTLINAYKSFLNDRKILSMEEDNLLSADTNFERTKELFELGQVTSVQFREAQLNLLRAKTNISSAKYSAKLSEINLFRISGKLLD